MPKEKKFSTAPASDKAVALMHVLNEHKARDVAALSLPREYSLAEIIILCTASSARHARSLADAVNAGCKSENFEILHTEGYQEADWVLVDLNDVIVHIFQESARARYHLESLWPDAAPFPPEAKAEAGA